MKTEQQMLDDLTTYMYGIIIILGFAAIMLVFHVYFSFFFHN